MNSRFPRPIFRFAFALACVPTLAMAQTPQFDAPFESIGRRLRVGQAAEVVDNHGLTVRGKVVDISSSKLVLASGTGTETFTGANVTAIRRPGPVWDGAVKGAVIGAAPWIYSAVECDDCNGLTEVAALSAAIGAGIGLGIDALFGPRTVYRGAPAASRVVRFIPRLSTHRKGLSAAIAF